MLLKNWFLYLLIFLLLAFIIYQYCLRLLLALHKVVLRDVEFYIRHRYSLIAIIFLQDFFVTGILWSEFLYGWDIVFDTWLFFGLSLFSHVESELMAKLFTFIMIDTSYFLQLTFQIKDQSGCTVRMIILFSFCYYPLLLFLFAFFFRIIHHPLNQIHFHLLVLSVKLLWEEGINDAVSHFLIESEWALSR